MRKRILCLDFDGVVHSYSSEWRGPRCIPDPPVPGALDFMSTSLVAGFRVAIFSSRSRFFMGRWAMRRWLKEWSGVQWEDTAVPSGLSRVEFPRYKPAAFVTLDDRAVPFAGDFPEIGEIEKFKSWIENGGT
jgi:hypothetical protein